MKIQYRKVYEKKYLKKNFNSVANDAKKKKNSLGNHQEI